MSGWLTTFEGLPLVGKILAALPPRNRVESLPVDMVAFLYTCRRRLWLTAVGTTHLPVTSVTALKNLAAFLCLSMLGTNVWLVVGFGICRLFVDGLLVSAHDRETPHPSGEHKIGTVCKQPIRVSVKFRRA